MDKKKGGLLERLSFWAIIAAITTGLAIYFGLPEYMFNTRPNLVSSLGSNTVSFIEGAISGTITIVLVLKLYSHITTNKEEEKIEPRFSSKTVHFAETLPANEKRTFFIINRKGSFQRLEVQAIGNPNSRMVLEIDDTVCWDESFEELFRKASKFLRKYSRPSTQSNAICSVELDLPKNFLKKLAFSVKNVDGNSNLVINGTAHYDVY
ncbi:MAG: hypothetical protein IBV52_08155 [Candidatus Bathyarchaeota archaeon]